VGLLAAALLATTAQVGTAAAQDARDTLRVAMYAKSVPRGNPWAIQNIWPSMYWWEAVLDTFVRIDEKGQLVPMAAEKWEIVNPTTWRLTFRKDMEFTTGRKNDAENVVKIFDHLASERGRVTNIAQTIKLASYKAFDSHTVEFVTAAPDPLLIPKLAQFYVGDMTAYAELGPDGFGNRPGSSGPYRVVSWNDQEMIGTVNEKSWRPAKIKNVRIVEIPEPASRLAALESGQMDLIINMGPDDVPRIRAAGHSAVVDGAPNIVSLALFTVDFPGKWNMGGKTPFSDKRVRQAVNYAINRDSMVKDFFKGMIAAASQPATPATYGYNPNVKPHPYDPAKAKQLLAEAGYPNGLSLLMEPIPANIIGGREILQIAAEDLAKVGVKVEINAMLFPAWSQLYNQKKWNGEMTSFSMILAPVMDASVPFSATYGCGHQREFTCIEELTPLVQAQAVEMDRNKRLALLQELMKKSNEESLSIMLFEGIDINGVGKRIKGFKNVHRVVHYDAMTIDG
jgi:peptide/nickel transport system substrate-binding protein